jgi:acetyl esterase/lipase
MKSNQIYSIPSVSGVRAVVGFVLLLLILCFHWGCDQCPPSRSNFAFIGYWDFPGGQTFNLVNEKPGSQTVDFIARVYYPSYDESVLEDPDDPNFEGITVADGVYPLIVFGHGQYGIGVPENYLGMTNLMHHLASWGYICVSINLDVVHGQWMYHQQGIPHRGELFLHAVDRMLGLNANNESLFFKKIDPERIALIGHSRGGGGAISAVNMNLAQGSPRSVKALATISPVDFHTDPVQAAVPHISLYGTWDGDLLDGEGSRIWDGGGRAAHKEFVEIYGANHFHFTDVVDYMNEEHEIVRENHHELAQGFINAYFDTHVKELVRYDWPLYLTGHLRLLEGVNYYIQYLGSDFRAIDNGGPLGTEGDNNLGGNNDGDSLAHFDDQMLNNYNDHFYNQSPGLLVHWNDVGDQLVFNFPVQNVSAYTHLHFRASQRPGNPLNVLDRFKNFRVRVRDNSGGSAVVSIKDYFSGLQYPDFSGSIAAGSVYQYKSIPRSFRIPFTDFPGVDFNQVTRVTFLFDQADESGYKNITGAIALDDLEFTR